MTQKYFSLLFRHQLPNTVLSLDILRLFLVVHPASSGHFWQLCNAGLAARLMSSASTPDVGMFVRIPVSRCLVHRLFNLLPRLETPPFERQRASGSSTTVQSGSSRRRRWAGRQTPSADR